MCTCAGARYCSEELCHSLGDKSISKLVIFVLTKRTGVRHCHPWEISTWCLSLFVCFANQWMTSYFAFTLIPYSMWYFVQYVVLCVQYVVLCTVHRILYSTWPFVWYVVLCRIHGTLYSMWYSIQYMVRSTDQGFHLFQQFVHTIYLFIYCFACSSKRKRMAEG